MKKIQAAVLIVAAAFLVAGKTGGVESGIFESPYFVEDTARPQGSVQIGSPGMAGTFCEMAVSGDIFHDTDAPQIKDFTADGANERIASGRSIERDGRKIPLFASDVVLRAETVEPNLGKGGTGIAELRCEIYEDGNLVANHILFRAEGGTTVENTAGQETNAENARKDTITAELRVPANDYESNDLRAVLRAADMAGNDTAREYRFAIDVTKPQVTVTYDNNDVRNGQYFNKGRIAAIHVEEKNLAAVTAAQHGELGVQQRLFPDGDTGGAQEAEGSRSKDSHEFTLPCEEDGKYNIQINVTDLAGNAADNIQFEGLAAQEFAVDTTAPEVEMIFSGDQPHNGKYYNGARTAEIRVRDENFSGINLFRNEAGGIVQIPVEAKSSGSAEQGSAAPSVEAKSPGSAEQGNPVSSEDESGDTKADSKNGKNTLEREKNIRNANDLSEKNIARFEAHFEEDGIYEITGWATDLAGNRSKTYKAEPFIIDTKPPVLSPEGIENGSANRKPVRFTVRMEDENADESTFSAVLRARGAKTEEKYEGEKGLIRVGPIEKDDYYEFAAQAADLAGNVAQTAVTFSENQKGTVFLFEQEEVRGKYINYAITPVFSLYNVDEVKVLSVTVNGAEVPFSYENGRIVLRNTLAADGKYIIGIETEDSAGNKNAMEPVEFIIDTAPPAVLVEGLKKGVRDYTEEFEIRLRTEDENDYFLNISYDGEILYDENGLAESEKLLENIDYGMRQDGIFFLKASQYGIHTLSFSAADAAGNQSKEENYEFELRHSLLYRWYSNPLLYIISFMLFGGIGVLAAVRVKRKRM